MEADGIARHRAGRQLIDTLSAMKLGEVVIVALSPQTVRYAFEASRRLGCEIDLLLAGRICAPGHPEQAIGSVLDLDEPQLSIDEDLARKFHVPPGFLDNERKRQLLEIARLHFMYLGDDEPGRHDHAGKDVVLLNDGQEPEIVRQSVTAMLRTGASSVRVVNVKIDGNPVEDTEVARMIRDARQLHRRLH